MKTLTLSMMGGYFSAIADGHKTEEYRLVTDFWRARLAKAPFDVFAIDVSTPLKGAQ